MLLERENLSDINVVPRNKIGARTKREEEKNSNTTNSPAELSKSNDSMTKVKISPTKAQAKEQFEKTKDELQGSQQ